MVCLFQNFMAVGLGIGPDSLVSSLRDAIGVVGLVAVFRKKFRLGIFYRIAFEVKISVYWTIFFNDSSPWPTISAFTDWRLEGTVLLINSKQETFYFEPDSKSNIINWGLLKGLDLTFSSQRGFSLEWEMLGKMKRSLRVWTNFSWWDARILQMRKSWNNATWKAFSISNHTI